MSYSIALNQSGFLANTRLSQSETLPNYKQTKTIKRHVLKNDQTASAMQELYFTDLGNSLSMKTIFPVHYTYEDGYYLIIKSIEGYIIAVAEQSKKDLAEAFKAELREAWNYYALEKDCNLTHNARSVKKWLISNIKEV